MHKRLDIFLKEKFGFSREYSKEIIKKGFINLNGTSNLKPSTIVLKDDLINVSKEAYPKYVSRSGVKLEKAILEFHLDLKDKLCMDIGASKGGFTDCMLQNYAKLVYSIDVGSKQLDEKLLQNKRVISFEEFDIRNFDLDLKFQFIAIDVSFISITKIIEKVSNILDKTGDLVVLIKPQFEAGKKHINKTGVIKDKKIHEKVVLNLLEVFSKYKFYLNGFTFSPIKGQKGNIEYLAYFNRKSSCTVFNIKGNIAKAFETLS